MIRVSGLKAVYVNNNTQVLALSDVSFTLEKGQTCAILYFFGVAGKKGLPVGILGAHSIWSGVILNGADKYFLFPRGEQDGDSEFLFIKLHK